MIDKSLNIHGFLLILMVSASAQGSRTAQACEWQSTTLTCPAGEALHIISANYGRTANGVCGDGGDTNCRAPASFNAIKNQCEGLQSCTVSATYTIYGPDPCYGTYKYVEVQYECLPATQLISRACEWNSVTITCPASKTLHIISANYGRTATGVCNSNGDTNCYSPTSFDIIQRQCESKASCTVWANYTLYGTDPCYNTYKYVEVQYKCVSASYRNAIACEWNSATLTCSAGTALHIISANYGRTAYGVCNANGVTNCYAPTSFDIVRNQCEGLQSCTVWARYDLYGPDPCYGTFKYVEVQYECLPATLYLARACDGSSAALTCPSGQFVHIISANYGRTANGVCDSNGDTNCRTPNSYQVVNNLCHRKPSCTVWANNTLYGIDPCAGTTKYVEVQYECLY